MKRILLFVLIVLSYYGVANAQKITEQQALLKAQKFMKDKKFSAKSTSLKRARAKGIAKEEEAFYIFNAEDNNGFVIVSGDERTEEILGYSDEGNVDLNNMPDNMASWLEGYAEQIKAIRQGAPIKRTRSIQGEAVEPLIKTKWGQGWPYNLMCPKINGQNCVTGCVPTAMAQILYYHKWPNDVLGMSGNSSLNIDSIPSTSFKWDKMKLEYNNNDSLSYDSLNAVSELMRYCGQALKVCYGLTGTSYTEFGISTYFGYSNFTQVLEENFNYSPNISYMHNQKFPSKVWENIIYEEISNGRPVLYDGVSHKDGGHSFICDGFDGKGLFHINWGWYGKNDGFFSLSLLDPNNLKDRCLSYSNFNSAIIGIRPPYQGEKKQRYEGVVFGFDPYVDVGALAKNTYKRDSLTHGFSNIRIRRLFYNRYDKTFDGEFGLALYQNGYDNEDIKYVLAVDTISINPYTLYDVQERVDFPPSISNGEYILSTIYRPQGEKKWKIPTPCFCRVTVTSDSLELNNLGKEIGEPQIIIHNVDYEGEMIEKKPIRIIVSFTNISDVTEIPIEIWEGKELVEEYFLHADPNATNKEAVFYTPKSSGEIEIQYTSPEYVSVYDGGSYITPRCIYYADKLTIASSKPSSSINTVLANEDKEVIYNLQGQRLQKPQRGINIINGKKVIIK